MKIRNWEVTTGYKDGMVTTGIGNGNGKGITEMSSGVLMDIPQQHANVIKHLAT